MLIILTASLSLSSSTNNCNFEEEKYSYELQLNENDPDVIKFANDSWNKLVSEGRTRGAKSRNDLLVFCARVQVINNERRYTILVKYQTDWSDALLYCTIFVWTNQKTPLTISCYKGIFHVSIRSN